MYNFPISLLPLLLHYSTSRITEPYLFGPYNMVRMLYNRYHRLQLQSYTQSISPTTALKMGFNRLQWAFVNSQVKIYSRSRAMVKGNVPEKIVYPKLCGRVTIANYSMRPRPFIGPLLHILQYVKTTKAKVGSCILLRTCVMHALMAEVGTNVFLINIFHSF